MTLKAVSGVGRPKGTDKTSHRFSVTLTVPFQVEVEATDAHEAAKKARTLPVSDVERIAVERGRVKCPTLTGDPYDIKRTILASERAPEGG